MTQWRPDTGDHEFVWFCVTVRPDALSLGRMVAHRAGTGIAYFFPGPLREPPDPADLAGLTPRDAFTCLSITTDGVASPDLIVLPDVAVDEAPWPLVEFETRADLLGVGAPSRRRRIRMVDDGEYLRGSLGDFVPESEYGIRADESSHKLGWLTRALEAGLDGPGGDDLGERFFDIASRLGAVYQLQHIAPQAPSPSRLVNVEFSLGPRDDEELWSDRIEEIADQLRLPDGDEYDGWEIGPDGTARLYLYTDDPDTLLARLANDRTIPRPAQATADPHTPHQATVEL